MERLYNFLSALGLIPAKGLSEQEVATLSQGILHNYAKSKSLLGSIKTSIPNKTKYQSFLKLVKSVELGTTPKMNSFSEKNSESAGTLLNILILGLRQRRNISKNLELFRTNLLQKIELRNKINSRVNGMQILSLLGLLFFFPLFSGISSALATYSLSSPPAILYVSIGIKAICLTYIFEILMITSSFLRPAERFLTIFTGNLSLLACSYLLQSTAYYLASYAI
ncbi:MAG: hypothetical protein KGH71_02875 [Candidatus Micrarchaeota archaeon]|nr:hypothetical protein [Candidatus Micrarchaeota archaeon]